VKLCKKGKALLNRLGEVQELASSWTSPATYSLLMPEGKNDKLFLKILVKEEGRKFSLVSHLLSRGLATTI